MKKNGFVGLSSAFFLLATLFIGLIVSCTESDKDVVKPKTITDVILENDEFSILRDIMLYTKMSDAFRTDELTLFAPTDAAFSKAKIFSSSVITSRTQDSARYFLKSHIIGKKTLDYAQLSAGSQLSLSGLSLSITKIDSNIAINKSDIVIKNVKADNGIIHVIDSLVVK